MNSTTLQPLTLSLLQRVFARSERAADDRVISLPITEKSSPEYFKANSYDELQTLFADLKQLEVNGCITLQWAKFHQNTQLERILLLNKDLLAESLGVQSLSLKLIEVKDRWERNSIHVDLQRRFIDSWAEKKKIFNIGVDQIVRSEQLMKIVNAVDAGLLQQYDVRSLSGVTLGNTKSIEQIKSSIVAYYREVLKLESLDPDEVMIEVGFNKTSIPMIIAGKICIETTSTKLQVSDLPYLGVPAEYVTIKPEGEPKYIITIENLSSFCQFCKKYKLKGIALYTGGYPNPKFRNVFSDLVHALPNVPVYHWGDLDADGWRIMSVLQKSITKREIKPHLMSIDLYSALHDKSFGSLTPADLKKMEQLNLYKEAKTTMDLVKSYGAKFEQELISNDSIVEPPCK